MATKPHHTDTTTNMATDLLSLVREVYPSLSKSDKKIAQFLLDSPSQFASASVKEVSAITDVSEATVVRFGRNVGCEGFKDLKILLSQHLAIVQAFKDSEEGNRPRPSGSYLDNVYHAAARELEFTAQKLPLEAMEKAAQAISKANRVFIYGTGGSSAILATEVQNRLFRLNINCTAYIDSYLQRMSAATMNENDVALFVSSTGRPASLLDSAELADYYGATTVAITDSNSPLARNIDVCLNVELSQSGVAHNQPNPMRFSQLLVIDCLVHRIAMLLGDKAESTLKRVRASVASMHGIVPQQPIGD